MNNTTEVEEKADHRGEQATNSNIEWIDDFIPLSMDDYLDSDPVDNHGDASFTGVWHAAKGLIKYFQQQQQQQWSSTTSAPTCSSSSFSPDKLRNILELGSGTGWLSITIGRNLPNIEHIVLTDSDHTGAIQWTKRNLESATNKQRLPNMDKLETKAMDWNNEQQVEQVSTMYPYDLIIGSDLIYCEDRIKPFVKTISTILTKQQNQQRKQQQSQSKSEATTRFFYAHTAGRMPEMDKLWEEELLLQNFEWSILDTIPQWDDRKTTIMEIRHSQKEA